MTSEVGDVVLPLRGVRRDSGCIYCIKSVDFKGILLLASYYIGEISVCVFFAKMEQALISSQPVSWQAKSLHSSLQSFSIFFTLESN